MSWLPAKAAFFRIERMESALVLCSIVAAFIGSIAFALGMAISAFNEVDPVGAALIRILAGTIAGFILVFGAGIVLALPTTWLAQHFNGESLSLYLVTGVLAGAACGVTLAGWPRSEEFLFSTILRLAAPFVGGIWGLLWRFTHRRWYAALSG